MNTTSVLFTALCIAFTPLRAQTQGGLGTSSEIFSLLRDTRAAINSYEVTLGRGGLLGPDGAENLSKGRRSVGVARSMLARLETNPEIFNSPVGFSLIVDLNEVRFFATDCKSVASMLAATDLAKLSAGTHSNAEREHVIGTAQAKLALSTDCLEAERQLTIASKVADSLYSRWLDAIRDCTGSKK